MVNINMSFDNNAKINLLSALEYTKPSNKNKVNQSELSLKEKVEVSFKVLQHIVTGSANFKLPVTGFKVGSKSFKFKKEKVLRISMSNDYLFIEEKKLGILVHVPMKEYKRNSQKAFNKLLDDYASYYLKLFEDFVLNENQEKLSKGAIKLAKKIKGEILHGGDKDEGYTSSINKKRVQDR